MLLLVGSIICILFNVGHGEIVVSPPGSPVYFWIDSPATISCTARVPSGNVEESVMLVQLTTGTDALSAVNCFTARSSPPLVNLLSPSFGNVTLSRSYPQSSAINCSYTFTPTSSFRDGSYSCIAAYQSPPSDVQTFVVVTSKQPDDVYINDGNPEITATEGQSINVTCAAINSKPAYTLSWNLPDIANTGISPTSQSTSNDYSNSTVSQTVVAAASMNGRTLTCSAISPIPNRRSQSATAAFNIYYVHPDTARNAQNASYPALDVAAAAGGSATTVLLIAALTLAVILKHRKIRRASDGTGVVNTFTALSLATRNYQERGVEESTYTSLNQDSRLQDENNYSDLII